MHIKYGDTGYIIDYIQYFLKENFSESVAISGVYDKFTHNSLIKYLELPEVQDMNTVYNEIESRFNISNYFYVERYLDSIKFIAFNQDSDTFEFMSSIYSEFKTFIYGLGWKIIEYTNYRNTSAEKYIIEISKHHENKIPNNELISMINKFDGTYYYNFYLDPSNNQVVKEFGCGYKIAMIPCNPDTEYTIAHGYNNVIPINVCSFKEYSIGNMRPIDKCESGYIATDGYFKYKTSSTARYILIQVPYILPSNNKYNVNIILGDVNFDNKIDEKDVEIIKKCVDGELKVNEEFFDVYDINGDKEITSEDYIMLQNFINSNNLKYVNKTVELEDDDTGTSLLVMKFSEIEEYKIPISDFNKNLWMIHDKLVSYILNVCITKYSRQDDISYLHNLVRGIYPGSKTGQSGIYTDELKGYVREYQYKNNVSFAFGYYDLDTEKLMLESGV